MKILWIGDAVINSGFSVVTHNICSRLYRKVDLSVFGIGYNGIKKNIYPYYVYPASATGNIYGFDLVGNIIDREEPDVVVIFNDDWAVTEYIKTINSDIQVVPLFPVNMLPISRSNMFSIESPEVLTYTEFSRGEVLKINPHLNVSAIYHGVDKNTFFCVDTAKVENGVDGLFIVGNVNSNTYRKRLDLFLEGFAKFAKGKPNVRAFIHASGRDGFPIADIAMELGITDKLMLSTSSVSESKLNIMYNLMDVNVNTSVGEGFGLSLIEGAACKVPVLCSNHGNLNDIWSTGAEFIEFDRYEWVSGTRFKGGIISTDDMADKLDKLYKNDYAHELGKDAFVNSEDDRFSWDVIASKVLKALKRANSAKITIIS